MNGEKKYSESMWKWYAGGGLGLVSNYTEPVMIVTRVYL